MHWVLIVVGALIVGTVWRWMRAEAARRDERTRQAERDKIAAERGDTTAPPVAPPRRAGFRGAFSESFREAYHRDDRHDD